MLIHGGNKTPGGEIPIRVLDQGHQEGMQEVISINTYPLRKIAYTAAGLTEFLGMNKNASNTVGALDWIITKFVYDGSNRMTDSQTLNMAWSSITAGAWDI